MKVIKKFNFFTNAFCKECGRIMWFTSSWEMQDAPSDMVSAHICTKCSPSYKYATRLFQQSIDALEENKHTPPHLKPKFKLYLVRNTTNETSNRSKSRRP